MIEKIVHGAVKRTIGKQPISDPVASAVLGAATMAVARRVLPGRIAAIGATVAAAYIGRKLIQREERRRLLRDTALTPPE